MTGNQSTRRCFRWFVFCGCLLLGTLHPAFAQEKPPVIFAPLPFDQSALEPFISSQTLAFHYGKHHAAYVHNANELLKGCPLENKSMEEIIKATAEKADQTPLFNNIAQAWNHAFFWQCLKPKGGGEPEGKLAKLIEESFGSFAQFKEEFTNSGKTLFGSGWVWLVKDGEKLKIVTTSNAETPLTTNQKPLFVVDVWEHAYYLDFQNRRVDFINVVLENLANWEFSASNL
ncbi:MAG: superoxide dismutase [Fe] [Candidatus Riflebacteria bacterium HGW-Riflebacteria-2]|jgi:Fe-Mn family superoxide dismutase|nr:MAG: superoxide dismutase [Fe] [Candidatus Riflebacteria bacterium HGW-Riflebacteria-2]